MASYRYGKHLVDPGPAANPDGCREHVAVFVPLTECPTCGNDLTAGSGVDLDLVVGGRSLTVSSSLTDDGVLMDTDDNAVSNGYHSETMCGKCGRSLQEFEESGGFEEGDPENATDVEQRIAAMTAEECRGTLLDLVTAVTARDQEGVWRVIRAWGFDSV
jgi:hypothetical protein